MNKKLEKLIERIGKDAVKLDWEVAFGGKSYGNRHLFRVNKIAKLLQSREGGDLAVILLGAWVHDVTLAFGSDYDEATVEKETKKFLDVYSDLDNELKDKVVKCAMSHESEDEAKTIEAKVVHDADALDKCGALGIIRHIWKMTNMLECRMMVDKKDLLQLESHLINRQTHLQTNTAVKLAKTLNKHGNIFFEDKTQAIKLMKIISTMAMEGKTSDVIVDWLIENENTAWVTILEKQINNNYY